MKPKRLEWTLNISKTRLAGNTFAGDAQKSPSCAFFQSLQTTRGFFSPVLKCQNFLRAESFNDVSTATFSLGFLLKQFLPGFHHLTHFGGGFSLILGWTNDTNKTVGITCITFYLKLTSFSDLYRLKLLGLTKTNTSNTFTQTFPKNSQLLLQLIISQALESFL